MRPDVFVAAPGTVEGCVGLYTYDSLDIAYDALDVDKGRKIFVTKSNDFAFFRKDSPAPCDSSLALELCFADPPYGAVPPGVASVYTPRNVSFTDGPRTYVDYSGRALAIYDRAALNRIQMEVEAAASIEGPFSRRFATS